MTSAMLGVPQIEWRGSTDFVPRRVISFLKAQRMVGKGCLSYLAIVRSVSVETPTIDLVLVVRDFSDVFLADLSGIPLEKDINYGINLVSGTQPISIPPNRMALAKLKEQHQQLIDKGFIRPSLSPWSAPVLFVKKKDGTMRMYKMAANLNNAPLGDLPPWEEVDNNVDDEGFVDSYWGSKQTNVSEDTLRLRLFPFSLKGNALDWLERLPNHSITTWDELVDKFIAKFFSPGHIATLRDEILAFKQEPTKPLHEIWEHYRTMCIVNQLAGGNFIKLSYDETCDNLDDMADTSSALKSRANVP
ncbi:uncharacterized protein [Nicotiana sylvestris]|uniref:uncharacterized protein n=1 Tax=Nicotiana sylvestris TaxID=4096 RepID=UPI00388C9A23